MSTIKRSKRNTPFVQIDKRGLQDKNLTWKAKGLLAYLLSLPDDWKLYVSELEKHSKDGRDATASGLNELIEAGYVIRDRVREKGKFQGYAYTVLEVPENGFSVNGLSVNGLSENGKPATNNNNSTNKHNTNNTHTTREEKSLPEAKTENFEHKEEGNSKPSLNADLTNNKFRPDLFEIDEDAGTPPEVQLVEYAVKVSGDYYRHYGSELLYTPVEQYQLNWGKDRIKKEIRAMWEYYSTEKPFSLREPHKHLHRHWSTWCRNGKAEKGTNQPVYRAGEYQFNH